MSVASSLPSTVAVRVVPSWSLTVTELRAVDDVRGGDDVALVSTTKPVPVAVDPDCCGAPPNGVG